MLRRNTSEVNAGSTADIAFLLLIFFLVTTTIETDKGINRKLPPKQPDVNSIAIKEKNIFRVLINAEGKLLVEDESMALKELKNSAIAFLDNGSGEGDEICSYCKGNKYPKSSVNPQKAVISIQNDRLTSYGDYIAVQNELVAAYTNLRNREALRLYQKSYLQMIDLYKSKSYKGDKAKLITKIEVIKTMYPQNLSEAEPISRQQFQ